MSDSEPNRWVRIIAWVAVAFVLLVRLPVFLAFAISPSAGTLGLVAGTLIGAAILRFVILKLGAFVSNGAEPEPA